MWFACRIISYLFLFLFIFILYENVIACLRHMREPNEKLISTQVAQMQCVRGVYFTRFDGGDRNTDVRLFKIKRI